MTDEIRVPQTPAYDPWELRAEAQRILSLLTMGTAYLWTAHELISHEDFGIFLLPPVVLGLTTTAAYVLQTRKPRLSAYGFVAGITVAGLCAAALYDLGWAPLFLIPPVVFAGVLVSPKVMAALAALIGVVLVFIARPTGLLDLLNANLVFTLALLAITALASWLSGRNLYTALRWAWESYSRAREETMRAREQRAQLRQALRSMDEASYRLQRMNYELARARDTAEELRNFKQQFVANVSHELRTPLALVAGFSEMMYLSPESYGVALPTEYQGDVREIYRNSQHLLSLIDDVLDLSRITAGKMLIARQQADPKEVILEAAHTIRPLIEGKGLDLEIAIDDRIPPTYLDPTRIRQVLLNLLNNARRFTDKGRVRLEAEFCDGETVVRVLDSGIGISLHDQVKIFEEFRQLDGSLSRMYDGAGLGLAISKEFVELHGGRIWVESEGTPGKGSVFSFTLPEQQREEDPSGIRRPVRTASLPPSQPLRRLILLSDDASITHLLERNLEGYQIVHLCDTTRLVDTVDRLLPEAIVLNANASTAGLELEAVQAVLGARDIPVVLCPLVGVGRVASHLGVEAYLIKPIHRETLLATLHGLGEQVRRVLIVDDDPRIVRLLARMLHSSSRRYELVRAYTGADGLEQLDAGGVDAVLLDLVLPDTDGYTFLRNIRQNPAFARLPIIIVTSKGYEAEDSQFLGGRMVGVSYDRGISNEESLAYLRSLLRVVESSQPVASAASWRSQEQGAPTLLDTLQDEALRGAERGDLTSSVGTE
ncbi:MAG: ATP-binding response regulator [Anaerolineae bacterium]